MAYAIDTRSLPSTSWWPEEDSDKNYMTNPGHKLIPTTFACVVAFMGPASAFLHASLTVWGRHVDMIGMYCLSSFLLVYGLLRYVSLPIYLAGVFYLTLVLALSVWTVLWSSISQTRNVFVISLVTSILLEIFVRCGVPTSPTMNCQFFSCGETRRNSNKNNKDVSTPTTKMMSTTHLNESSSMLATMVTTTTTATASTITMVASNSSTPCTANGYLAGVQYLAACLACYAIGWGFWAKTKSGGPLCQPDSLFQGHAVWHIFTAFSLGFAFLYMLSEDRQHGVLINDPPRCSRRPLTTIATTSNSSSNSSIKGNNNEQLLGLTSLLQLDDDEDKDDGVEIMIGHHEEDDLEVGRP